MHAKVDLVEVGALLRKYNGYRILSNDEALAVAELIEAAHGYVDSNLVPLTSHPRSSQWGNRLAACFEAKS